ncbi:2TM domain-containing protein [Actinoplanes sp. KI2]|uniref:2TM domain-containing protein n=1 Tax=Actinoplanes sp. KI2 TaxID=2983315 RepID=UPI0021D58FF7|nr:2TM domain-containing protein [Actinoplanes sp. KI2]MCU7729510.1 2TM domain-containing protein [Actinoplanes sp. KI2]
MSTSELKEPAGVPDLRAEAVARLRKRRDFGAHVLAYVLVNLFLNGIWWVTTPGGFYWPIIPMLGWGIGLVFHAWDVYFGSAPSEEAIRHEMDRLSRH